MSAAPILADFVVRLAFGLAITLLLTSWRAVPLPFFRTGTQVVLSLLVLAALDQARAGGERWVLWCLIAGAVLAYLATLAWGLGLPKLGKGAIALLVLATLGWLVAASRSAEAGLSLLNTSSRLASGFLIGSTLTAMLLGHYYLTAPAMSIEPLKRLVAFMAGGLVARCLLAGIGVWAQGSGYFEAGAGSSLSIFGTLLTARWGIGFFASGVATYMTWKTATIRSTQSATGILYISMIFVLFGELTSMVVAGRGGGLS
jgi:hypothetical protein